MRPYAVCLVVSFVATGVVRASDKPVTSLPNVPRFSFLANAPAAALAFSQDGKRLAAAARNEVQLYEIYSGRMLSQASQATSEGQTGPASLTFSPNGRKLVSVHDGPKTGPKQVVVLWDIDPTGTLNRTHTLLTAAPSPTMTPDSIPYVEFSPDGKSIVAGGTDGMIYLWEAATGKEKLRFDGGAFAHFAASGKTLITVSRDSLFHAFDASSGRPVQPSPITEPQQLHFVSGAAVAASSSRVAIWEGTYLVSIHDSENGAALARFKLSMEYLQSIVAAAMSADGKMLVFSSRVFDSMRPRQRPTSKLDFFDAETGRLLGSREEAEGYSLAFSHDGKFVAWPEANGVAIRETAKVLASLTPPASPAKFLPCEPPEARLAAELVARTSTYKMHTQGQTPEQLGRLMLADLDKFAEFSPKVDLELRVRNDGKRAVTFDKDLHPWLHLEGIGAVNPHKARGVGTGGPLPEMVTLAPGQSHSVRITRLTQYYDYCFWLLPGEYKVHAWLWVRVEPAVDGHEDKWFKDSTRVTLRPAPVTVRVTR